MVDIAAGTSSEGRDPLRIMTNPLAGHITLQAAIRILVTVVTVVLATVWMAYKQNEQAQKATLTMVGGGLAAWEDHVKAFARDYALWDAGYDAYVAGDKDWLYENIGSGITETEVADIVVMFGRDGKVTYQAAKEELNVDPLAIFTPEVIGQIQDIAKDIDVAEGEQRAGYLRSGNDILMIAVAHITPVSRLAQFDTTTLPYMVIGLYLNKERLVELGQKFLIDDLHLEFGAPGPEIVEAGFPVISNMLGQPIASMTWSPPTPGFAVLRNVFLPLAGGILLSCLFAIGTALRTRNIAAKLAASESSAVTAARRDNLTGLMNRYGFNEALGASEFKVASEAGEMAMIYIDINGFKSVNDSIGHHGGDELVKLVAARLRATLPPGTTFARIGGDEFAATLLGKNVNETAAGAAAAMVHAFDEPFTVSGFEFHATAAVGYAVAAGQRLSPAELLRRADLAMYLAKNVAEREALVYHPTMETGALEKKQVEAALRRAVEADEIKVFYQPVVRAADMTVVGLEALVRWNSKEFGNVAPALFIPVAEETGLIHDIGRAVMRQACQDMKRWPDLKIAINVSPVQLRDPNFADDLMAIVRRHDVSPHQFELELTEGILVNNPTIAKRRLAVLKELGFVLSLDDFGTGFSSIGYLRQFPFDILKVDRSFIRDIGLNATANALIQSLVSLGDAMNLSVIAEGIENEDQLKLLRLVQCEYLQGFLISRPVPAAEIDRLLASLGEKRQVKIGGGPTDQLASAAAPG
jgi:diguanylate cyclase (GGDEF)-like protein